MRFQALLFTTLLISTFVPTACRMEQLEQEGAGSGQASSDTAAAPETMRGEAGTQGSPSPSTRVALPGLFSIMASLERSAAGISRGLWQENFDTIAAHADAIADHPAIPPGEREAIAQVLGEDMAGFGSADQDVHDLAAGVAERARAGNLEGVLELDARLRRSCVSCHTTFRSRLREGLR